MENESASASDAPVLEIEVLKRMLGDDEEVIEQFLRSFLRVTRKQFVELAQAVEEKETQRIADVAHTLKSSARWIGANSLGEQFAELEACKEASSATQTQFEEIRQQYGKLTVEIERLLLRAG